MTKAPAADPVAPTGGTCFVLHPRIGRPRATGERTPQNRLAEAVGLAEAIGLAVVQAEVVPVPSVHPGTLFGAGTLERIAAAIKGGGEGEGTVGLVVVDGNVTPVQQRSLEKAWQTKVIDRTGLILEIFGERARTAEGRLQVELAALTYQRSRLVRSWTHLERQRGGFGFLGGPGESQLETDRRLIDERIIRLRRALKDVKRTRSLHRSVRKRIPLPLIALVGYTNAGKSTLFNRLTEAHVVARDQLFATLDPTVRRLRLPSGQGAALSDTVGFISDLPHELVEAFHATLEEVTEADLIVHVRDGAHPESEAQKEDVLAVLAGLRGSGEEDPQAIEAVNKIDLMAPEDRAILVNRAARANGRVTLVSARTGEGCDELLAAIETVLERAQPVRRIAVPGSDGAAIAWLHAHGHVLAREAEGDFVHVTVRLSDRAAARFVKRCPGSTLHPA